MMDREIKEGELMANVLAGTKAYEQYLETKERIEKKLNDYKENQLNNIKEYIVRKCIPYGYYGYELEIPYREEVDQDIPGNYLTRKELDEMIEDLKEDGYNISTKFVYEVRGRIKNEKQGSRAINIIITIFWDYSSLDEKEKILY